MNDTTYDVLLRGGRVLDGTGAPAYRADVAVRSDRIAAIGRLDGARARTGARCSTNHRPTATSRSGRCCGTRRTSAAPTASTSGAARTRAAGARSPGCSRGTWSNSATGPGNRPSYISRLTRPAGSGSPTRVGLAADVAVIDPARVADRADYGDARRCVAGIDDVLVAGVSVLASGALAGHPPGRPVRPS
jgi:hypothetical protein